MGANEFEIFETFAIVCVRERWLIRIIINHKFKMDFKGGWYTEVDENLYTQKIFENQR